MGRSKEITKAYFELIDQHIKEVAFGHAEEFKEIQQIASELFVSHQHLSATIQKETGHHPCYFYDQKIIDTAKKMLIESDESIAKIARRLTYDPSNFSKFFKKLVGNTPHIWRINHRK